MELDHSISVNQLNLNRQPTLLPKQPYGLNLEGLR